MMESTVIFGWYEKSQQRFEDERLYKEYTEIRMSNEIDNALKYVLFIIETYDKFKKTFIITDEYAETMKDKYEKYKDSIPTFRKHIYHTLKCFVFLETYKDRLILDNLNFKSNYCKSAYMIYDRETARYSNNDNLNKDFEKEYY